MRKSVIALILAALMLLCCGCSDSGDNSTANNSFGGMFDDNSGSYDDDDVIIIEDDDDESSEDKDDESSDLPEGWVTHNEGPIYISYPEDDFRIVTAYGADFQIVDDNNSNINILCFDNPGYDISIINDTYLDDIVDYAVPSLDSAYEESLGCECETTGSVDGSEIKKVGGVECACLYYSIDVYATEYDTTIAIDYFQVIYFSEDYYYTVTFTHFPYDTGISAEEYFADIIENLRISDDVKPAETEDEENEISFLPELPDGWVTHKEDNIYLSYPADEFDITTDYGADFQIIDDEGSNINIICHDTTDFDMDDISDSYIESILEEVIGPLDSIYEEALGTECDTTGSSGGYKMMTFGNEECACLYYTVNMHVPEYDTTIVLDYFQVLYASDDNYYTITFTYSPSASNMSAEEFFADIINYLYIA